MVVFSFYRFYLSIAAGFLSYFLVLPSIWFSVAIAIGVRVFIGAIEKMMRIIAVDRCFKLHEYRFKQLLGPYGIRMINKAEKSFALRKSLYEVF
ncbi:MAG: hypothetical protein PHC61_13280, partial [Chitinivibrionales bacterium]|nr:hypothetical protein [Chitinivibrionales bacterium]